MMTLLPNTARLFYPTCSQSLPRGGGMMDGTTVQQLSKGSRRNP